MGLFDGIKRALNVGGVSLKLEAPASISLQDPAVAVRVTLSSKSAQTIEDVTVRLYRQRQMQMSDVGTEDNSESDLAKMVSPVGLTFAPGEAKTLDLTLPLGASGLTDDVKQQNHYVEARAKVSGTMISPKDYVQVQVLGPGQIGTAASTQL
jgi:hypothetical protein